MIILVTALGGTWSVEQPDGSVLMFYPTFRYVLASIQMIGGPSSVQISVFHVNTVSHINQNPLDMFDDDTSKK